MQTKRYRSTYLIWHTSSCVRKFGIAFTNPRINAKIVIAFCVNLLTDFELIGVIERRKSRWRQICGLDDAKFVVTCDFKGFISWPNDNFQFSVSYNAVYMAQ